VRLDVGATPTIDIELRRKLAVGYSPPELLCVPTRALANFAA
jgi:hypothetical protein